MVQTAGRAEKESGKKWTTVCIEKDWKEEIEKQEFDYGDSWDSFLKSQLEINKQE